MHSAIDRTSIAMCSTRKLKRRAPGGDEAAIQSTDYSVVVAPNPASVPSSSLPLSGAHTFSFAPNVTPSSFTAPPPGEEDDLAALSKASPTLFLEATIESGLDQNASAGYDHPTAKRRRSTKTVFVPIGVDSPSSTDSPRPPSPSRHSKTAPKRSLTRIPRPPNAFILFRSSFIRSQLISSTTEGNHGTLSKIAGMLWHQLSYEDREVWQAKARVALAEHKRMYPNYHFKPSKGAAASASLQSSDGGTNDTSQPKAEDQGDNKTTMRKAGAHKAAAAFSSDLSDKPTPPKRRTRAVGPRDTMRCEHIASLLARGVKGAALDAAMREFDSTREPEVIETRFEAPLTAEQFESAADDEYSKEDAERRLSQTKATSKEDITMANEGASQARDEPKFAFSATASLPVRAIRRSSSLPLLGVEVTEAMRRQTTFMPNAPAQLYDARNDYPQQAVMSPMDGPIPQRASSYNFSQVPPMRRRSSSASPPERMHTCSVNYTQTPMIAESNNTEFAFHCPMSVLPYATVDVAYPLEIDTRITAQQFHAHAHDAHYVTQSFPGQVPSVYDISTPSASSVWDDNGLGLRSFSFENLPPPATGSITSVAASPFEQPVPASIPTSVTALLSHEPSYASYAPHQPMHTLGQVAQAPSLTIQTSWDASEFSFSPISPSDVSPPSARSFGSGRSPASVALDFDFPTSISEGSFYASPSPAPQSMSCGALTPRDDPFDSPPATDLESWGITTPDSRASASTLSVNVNSGDYDAYLSQARKLVAQGHYDIHMNTNTSPEYNIIAQYMGTYI